MKPQEIRNELAAIITDLTRKLAAPDEHLLQEAYNIQAIGAALSSLGNRIEKSQG